MRYKDYQVVTGQDVSALHTVPTFLTREVTLNLFTLIKVTIHLTVVYGH